MDIFNLLKNMDPETLKKGIAQATEFLSTPEGKDAAKMLTEGKMPDSLKSIAEAVKGDEKARDVLGELTKRVGKTP